MPKDPTPAEAHTPAYLRWRLERDAKLAQKVKEARKAEEAKAEEAEASLDAFYATREAKVTERAAQNRAAEAAYVEQRDAALAAAEKAAAVKTEVAAEKTAATTEDSVTPAQEIRTSALGRRIEGATSEETQSAIASGQMPSADDVVRAEDGLDGLSTATMGEAPRSSSDEGKCILAAKKKKKRRPPASLLADTDEAGRRVPEATLTNAAGRQYSEGASVQTQPVASVLRETPATQPAIAQDTPATQPAMAQAPRCANCHRVQPPEAPKFRACTKCVSEKLVAAVYCSKDCQKDHWPKHKKWHAGMRQLMAEALSPEEAAESMAADPDEYSTLLKRGLRECAAGKAAAGIDSFRKAVEQRPEQAVGHANLGHALRNAGDFDGALPALVRASELYDDDTEAWATITSVAWFTFASGAKLADAPLPSWMVSLEERIPLAERCAVAAPRSMQCHALLGMALAEQDVELGRAASSFMRAASLTDQPATKEGYLKFAKSLLERVQTTAPAHGRTIDQ